MLIQVGFQSDPNWKSNEKVTYSTSTPWLWVIKWLKEPQACLTSSTILMLMLSQAPANVKPPCMACELLGHIEASLTSLYRPCLLQIVYTCRSSFGCFALLPEGGPRSIKVHWGCHPNVLISTHGVLSSALSKMKNGVKLICRVVTRRRAELKRIYLW